MSLLSVISFLTQSFLTYNIMIPQTIRFVLPRVTPICWPISSQQLIHGDHQPAHPATDLSGEKLLAAEKN